MKKRIGFLLVMLVMLYSISAAFADNVHTSGRYTYEIKGNGTITITDFDWNDWSDPVCDIFIPEMIDGYSVTGIGAESFAMYLSDNLPNGLFLKNITIPKTVTSIGAKAFYSERYCSLSINIPDSIQHIGYGAFAGADDLQLKISPTQQYFAVIDGVLYNKGKKELIACGGAEKLIIPEGIKSIGDYAFCRSSISESITFPSSLERIGDYAFYDCYFGSKVFRFDRNFNLGESSIVSIGEYAFANAGPGAERFYPGNVTLPISLEYVGAHAFENMGVDRYSDSYISITLPAESKVTTIPDYAFYGIEGEVIIQNPSAISEIGEYAGCGDSFSSAASFSLKIKAIPTGLNPSTNELPDTINTLESKSFLRTVKDFKLPASLSEIAIDSFGYGSTFIVESGSYAELWCSENGFGYTIEGQNNLDWLNN